MNQFGDQQDERSSTWNKTLGTIVALMLQSKTYPFYPIGSLAVWIQPAIYLHQAKVFYNSVGTPVGYLVWAYLTEEVESCIKLDPNYILDFSEWNEGDRLWLVDFMALPGWTRPILRCIKSREFANVLNASWIRRKDSNIRYKRFYRKYQY